MFRKIIHLSWAFVFSLGLLYLLGWLLATQRTEAASLSAHGPLVVSGTASFLEQDLGVRLRAFGNNGVQKIFLGIPDLGVGSNRTESNLTWVLEPGCNVFTFKLDRANDQLQMIVVNSNGAVTTTYSNLAAQLASKGKAYTLDDLNVMQIATTIRNGTLVTVSLQNLSLDGFSLGVLTGIYTGTTNWTIRNYDFGATNGFTLTGQLCLAGSFSNSQELNKVDITVGYLQPNIDLSINKTGPTIIAPPPREIVYTLTLTNNGSDIAKNIIITDPTPANLNFVSASAPCTSGFPCAFGKLPSGDTATINVTYSVPANYTTPNPILNVVSIASSITETITANNTATFTTTLLEPIAGLIVTNDSPTTLGQLTTFTASLTRGNAVSYEINFGDGLTMTNGAVITHPYATAGIYTAIVTATNALGSMSATTLVTITNRAPIANAGADISATVGALVRLDGSASSDPDGHVPLSYQWTQIGGVTVALSNATNITATFTAPTTPTVLTFSLIVTDAKGLASLADSVVVTITDVVPGSLSAINDSPTTLGQATTFTTTLVTGTNVLYSWNFGDGSPVAAPSPNLTTTHIYSATGTYTAIVTVTNTAGSASATTFATITNMAPLANAGADASVAVGTPVSLNGSNSADPDGHLPLSYRWTQTGGPVVSLSTPTNVTTTFTAPLTPTVLTFALVVTDARGLNGIADSIRITVTDVAITGLSIANSSPTILGQATAFTATRSAGTNVIYAWDFGDGAVAANGATISHAYATAGAFTVIVTATNGQGNSQATTTAVVVNLAPVAQAGSDQVVNVGAQVTLNGSSSYDPNNNLPLAYHWEQVGGPKVSLPTQALSITNFTAPSAPTVLTFTLVVTDKADLVSAADTIVVTVNDIAISGLQIAGPATITTGVSAMYTISQTTGTNIQYVWSVDGAPIPGGSPFAYTFSTPGVYPITVVATNGAGSQSAQMLVTVIPALRISYLPLIMR